MHLLSHFYTVTKLKENELHKSSQDPKLSSAKTVPPHIKCTLFLYSVSDVKLDYIFNAPTSTNWFAIFILFVFDFGRRLF